MNRIEASARKSAAAAADVGAKAASSMQGAASAAARAGDAGEQMRRVNTRAFDNLVVGGQKAEKAIGLTNYQMTNLSFQLNDVATTLAMGMSPFQIMAQQGGQVLQIMQGAGGGVRGGLTDLKDRLFGLVTPTRAITAGFIGMGAAAIAAAVSWSSAMRGLEKQMQGIGRMSGLSPQAMAQLALRNRGEQSALGALETAGTLAAAGLDARTIAGATAGAGRFGRAFGLDSGEANATLAKMFADPAKGAEQVRQQFGLLTDATNEQIRYLAESGQIERARAILLREFNTGLRDTTKELSGFSAVWNKVTTAFGNFAGMFASNDAARLDALLRQRQSAFDQMAVSDPLQTSRFFRQRQRRDSGMLSESQRNQLADLEFKSIAEGAAAAALAVRQREAQASFVAGSFARQLVPEAEARKELEKAAQALAGVRDPTAQMSLALDRARMRLAAFISPLEQIREETALMVRETLARTQAERTLVQQQRAYLETLRQTGDPLQAAAQAERARQQAIADGAKQAREYLRGALEERSMIGLSPFAQRQRQREIEARRLVENTAVGGPLDPALLPLKTGADRAKTILDQFSDAVARATGSLTGQGGFGGIGGAARGALGAVGGWLGMGGASGGGTVGGTMGQFLAAIKAVESGGRYDVRYGGAAGPQTFSDFSRHPGLYAMGPHGPSSAAGAYQITQSTYRDYGGGSFTPSAQDQMAIRIAVDRFMKATGESLVAALGKEGLSDRVIRALGPTWRGLVDNPARAKAAFAGAGGAGAAAGSGDTRGVIGAGLAIRSANDAQGVFADMLRSANLEIAEQEQRLAMLAQTYGMSNQQLAEASKRLEMQNRLTREGIAITPDMQAQIDSVAAAYGRAATAQERYQQGMQAINDLRGALDSGLSSFVGALMRGESGAKALNAALQSLAQSLARMAQQMLMDGLFGGRGGGGGLLSGLFRGFLGGGGSGVGIGDEWTYANGGAFSGGRVIPFASGGIVNRPTLFPMANGAGLMGEAGPEAIMPLRRGSDGKLGVAAQMAQGGGTVINIVDQVGVQKQQKARRGSDGREIIDVVLSAVKTEMAGGGFDSSMQGRFAAKPRKVIR